MPPFTLSERLRDRSDLLSEALSRTRARLNAPDTRKSDKDLRRFSLKEVAEICLRMNYNTLRSHLKNIPELPQGVLEPGNRRTFTLDEIHDLQDGLYDAGKIPEELYPGRFATEKVTQLIVYNLKGGVSKTSTVANLAQALALRGFRILVVDLDPQASCSDLFDVQADVDEQPSIYDAIKWEDPMQITEIVQATYFPKIDIIPGSIALTEFEFESAMQAAKGRPFYGRISSAIAQIADNYDLVLYDTPPHMSFSVIAALEAANAILIPLSAGMLDVVSLEKFMDLASETMSSIEGVSPGKEYDFMRFVLTRYSAGDAAQMQLQVFLRSVFGADVLQTEFVQSTAIADAGNTMNPLMEIDPTSFHRKTYERILESVQGIAREIEDEIMTARGRRSERAA